LLSENPVVDAFLISNQIVAKRIPTRQHARIHDDRTAANIGQVAGGRLILLEGPA
jgi:hypothetical protein